MIAAAILRRVAGRTSKTQKAVIGYVDEVGANRIRGWVAATANLAIPLPFKVYLDGDLVSQGIADGLREDVGMAGYGDGRHGFDMSLPAPKLAVARTLQIIVEIEGRFVEFVKRPLRKAPAPSTKQRVYLDVSDLIEFFRNYREVSGIQRVQCGYIIGLLSLQHPKLDVKICARTDGKLSFTDIPAEKIIALIEAAGSVNSVPQQLWKGIVEKTLSAMTENIAFRNGDILITLGAPWAVDGHNAAIRYAKSYADIFYFQTFYDLIPLLMPEVVPEGLVPVFAHSIAGLFAHADHVFSISDYSAQDLERAARQIGRRHPPISLVKMGGNIDRLIKTERQASRGPRVDIGDFDLSQPFVLCIGTLEPRKNHDLLYRVWRLLLEKHGREAVPKLVLVGRIGWHMEEFVRTLRVSKNLDGAIVHLTNISDGELGLLYEYCLFTVFPSFYEGWGLPITESFLHNKPCVCSNVTSMPEAGGEYAIYFDPYNVRGAFDVIETMIFDEDTRARSQQRLASWQPTRWADASVDFAASILRARDEARSLLKAEANFETVLTMNHLYRFGDGKLEASAIDTLSKYIERETISACLDGSCWFLPDPDQTWACGQDAKFVLRLQNKSESSLIVYFEIEFGPNNVNREFEVLVDGISGGVFAGRDGINRVAVGLGRLPGTVGPRIHRVVFSLRDYAPGFDNGLDNRLIGLGVRSMYICENNAESRLKYYENNMISVIGPSKGLTCH